MKTLVIDDKWSVTYDPDNNDRPVSLMRYGEEHVIGPADWKSDQVAMFYTVLSMTKEIEQLQSQVAEVNKLEVERLAMLREQLILNNQCADLASKLLKTEDTLTKVLESIQKVDMTCIATEGHEAHCPSGDGWKPIETAPLDGTTVLLFTTCHGVCEAWFAKGEWSDDTPNSPAEYSGPAWICCDDAFEIEVEEDATEFGGYYHWTATHWMQLPIAPDADVMLKALESKNADS